MGTVRSISRIAFGCVVALGAAAFAPAADAAGPEGELFKQAMSASQRAVTTADPGEKLRLLRESDTLVEKIIRDHATTPLAKMLSEGKAIGNFRRADIKARLAEAQKVVPASPLLGDWAWRPKNSACPSAVLSITEANGMSLKGYFDISGAAEVRHINRAAIAAHVDADTKRFVIDDEKWLLRNRSHPYLPRNFDGMIDLAAGVLTTGMRELGTCRKESGNIVLKRETSVPVVGARIEALKSKAESWKQEERTRIRSGRVVGGLPEGTFAFPGCAAVETWWREGKRLGDVKLIARNSGSAFGGVRDDISQKYFGSPAYYWLGENKYLTIYDKNCDSRTAPNADEIRRAFFDNHVLAYRRKLDLSLADAIPDYLAKADPPEVQMAILQSLNSVGEFKEKKRDWIYDDDELMESDYAPFVQGVVRFQHIVAADILKQTGAKLAAVEPSIAGFAEIDGIATKTHALLGAGLDAEQASLTAAAAARRTALAEELTAKSIAELSKYTADISSFQQISEDVGRIKEAMGPALAAKQGPALDKAMVARWAEISREIVERQTAKIGKAPTTLDHLVGVQEETDRTVRVLSERGFAKDAAPLKASYAAYEARVRAIAIAETVTRLDNLVPKLENLATAEALRDKLHAALGAEGRSLAAPVDQSFTKFQERTRTQILADAHGALGAISTKPEDLDAVQQLCARTQQMLGDAAASLGLAFEAECKEKVQTIASSAATDFGERLAKSPAALSTIPAIMREAEALSTRFEGTVAASQFPILANQRIQAIHKHYADTAEAKIEAAEVSWKNYRNFLTDAETAAAPLRERDDAAEADRITAAAFRVVRQQLAARVDAYRSELDSRVNTRANIHATSREVIGFYQDVALLTELSPYIASGRGYVRRAFIATCSGATKGAGIGREADLPVLLGNRIVPLGAFACAFTGSGATVSDFAEPGFFGKKIWKLSIQSGASPRLDVELEMREVMPKQEALVGVRASVKGEMTALPLDRWRAFAGGANQLWVDALADEQAHLCGTAKGDVTNLPPREQERFVLACD